MKNTTPLLKNWTDPASCRRHLFRITLAVALAWLALRQTACAEDGDLGSGNTAEGFLALAGLSGGFDNTAIGAEALSINASGNYNPASGAGGAEVNNGDNNTATGYAALDANT